MAKKGIAIIMLLVGLIVFGVIALIMLSFIGNIGKDILRGASDWFYGIADSIIGIFGFGGGGIQFNIFMPYMVLLAFMFMIFCFVENLIHVVSYYVREAKK